MRPVYGLTGGIGTGKTTVLELLASYRNVGTLSTDEIAKAMLKRDFIADSIVSICGNKVAAKDGIDPKRLAKVIFSNPEKKAQVEAIIHPEVWGEVARVTSQEKDGLSFWVVESALIFETGAEEHFDATIATFCPLYLQVKRAMEGKGLTEAEAMARITSQLPAEEVAKRADYVVNTELLPQCVKRQVEFLYQKLKGGSDD